MHYKALLDDKGQTTDHPSLKVVCVYSYLSIERKQILNQTHAPAAAKLHQLDRETIFSSVNSNNTFQIKCIAYFHQYGSFVFRFQNSMQVHIAKQAGQCIINWLELN